MPETLENSRSLDTVGPRRSHSDDIVTKTRRYKETTESTVFNGDVKGYVGTIMKAEIVIAHAEFNLSPNKGSNHPHPPMVSGISSHGTGSSAQIPLQMLAPLVTESLKDDGSFYDSPPTTPDQELEREAAGKRLLTSGLYHIEEGSRLLEKGKHQVKRAQRLLACSPEEDRGSWRTPSGELES